MIEKIERPSKIEDNIHVYRGHHVEAKRTRVMPFQTCYFLTFQIQREEITRVLETLALLSCLDDARLAEDSAFRSRSMLESILQMSKSVSELFVTRHHTVK